MSIPFQTQVLSAAKAFWQGTHRTTSPEVTLATIKPYFRCAGLTRLSHITHLDRLGIPVTQAIRPNSYSLTVSGGKGLTLTAALASAAMEALEMYCAETAPVARFELSYLELAQRYPHIPLVDLPLCQHSLFQVEQPQWWCLGWDLIQQQQVAVPWECVILDYRLRQGNWSHLLSFEMSSNGLASGNHLLEAITAGLLELVERDAITCCSLAQSQVGFRKPQVKLETIDCPQIQSLLQKFTTAGLEIYLFDCTIDTGIPVYEALCFAPTQEAIAMGIGCGAHLDPKIAMARALTEAAQTRAAAISGTRDDFFTCFYTSFWLRDTSKERAQLAANPATVDARDRTSEATDSFEGDLEVILTRLQQVGRQQAIVVNLTPPNWEISVVRVIVPGLEGSRPHDYRPKHRAAAFVQAQAGDG